jgi:hypothetical protein
LRLINMFFLSALSFPAALGRKRNSLSLLLTFSGHKKTETLKSFGFFAQKRNSVLLTGK